MVTEPGMRDPRPAIAQHLHYKGDVTDGLTVGRAMGPNTMGELLYVVGWDYDPDAGRTTVDLAYVMPPRPAPFAIDGRRMHGAHPEPADELTTDQLATVHRFDRAPDALREA